MTSLRHYLRFALRGGSVSAFAIATIAIGIAATCTVFALVDGVLLRPLPYPVPDRIISIWERETSVNWAPGTVYDVSAWKRRATTLENLTAYRAAVATLTGILQARRLQAVGVTPEFFAMSGVAPLIGSTSDLGGLTRVVISEKLWRTVYNGNPAVLGRTMILDRKPYVVAAVMDRKFGLPLAGVDVWMPFLLANEPISDVHYLRVLARLRPGRSLDQARSELAVIDKQLDTEEPAAHAGVRARVVPIADIFTEQSGPILRLLSYAAGCLLLIACVNLGGLLLAQNTMREGEFAVRSALGASRGALVRQLLAECSALVALGGVLGLALTPAILKAFIALVPGQILRSEPALAEVSFNPRVLLFAFAASFLAAVLAGIVPAMIVSRRDLNPTLQMHARSVAWGRSQRAVSAALMIFESALAVTLVSICSVLVRHALALESANPGFNPQQVMAARVTLPEQAYPTPQAETAFFSSLLEKSQGHAALADLAFIDNLPLGGTNYDTGLLIEGQPLQQETGSEYTVVSPRYFEVMRVPLLAGRYFNARDRAGSAPVTIINDKMAQRFWPKRSPIGMRVRTGELNAPWREIVGVVGSVRWHEFENEPVTSLHLYVPYLQDPRRAVSLVVRTSHEADAFSAIRKVLSEIDHDVPVSSAFTMHGLLADANGPALFSAVLMSAFALFSLLLAAGGIYGCIAFSMSRRTLEFAIRTALGATKRRIRNAVILDVLKFSVVGAVAGLALAPSLSHVARALIYNLPRIGLPQAVCAILTVLCVIAGATWLAATRTLASDRASTL